MQPHRHFTSVIARSGAREQNWAVLTDSTEHSPKLLVAQLVKKLSAFYRNRMFIAVFTTATQLDRILSHINVVTLRSCFFTVFLNRSYHLHLGLPSGLFHSCFPTIILSAFLISTRHFTFLDLLTLIKLGEEYKLWRSLSCPPPPHSPGDRVTFSFSF